MKPRAAKAFPKISTMPRKQSEATAHLEMYKLLVEKQRLQQELQTLEQRQQQITERLTDLETQVGALEQTTHRVQSTVQATVQAASPAVWRSAAAQPPQPATAFDTLLLEY